MGDNAEADHFKSEASSSTDNNRVAAAVSSGTPSSAPYKTEMLTHLDELKALCHILINPEAQTYIQVAENFRSSSPQEQLFMRQQEEQERRRRFLQPSTLRYCPMKSITSNNSYDIRRLLQSNDVVRAAAIQTKINILNKFGATFTATQENNDKCAICLQMYESNEILRKLKCSHIFHQCCVDRWIWKEISCPICRSTILRYVDNPNVNAERYGTPSSTVSVGEAVGDEQMNDVSGNAAWTNIEDDVGNQQPDEETPNN